MHIWRRNTLGWANRPASPPQRLCNANGRKRAFPQAGSTRQHVIGTEESARERWRKLTENDGVSILGTRDQLVRPIQERMNRERRGRTAGRRVVAFVGALRKGQGRGHSQI